MLVAEMGGVVGQLVLDAGSRGAGVAATKRDTVQQVASIHIAFDAAAREKIEWVGKMNLHFVYYQVLELH